jgi:UDPglucose 6-dehydrogenase
MRVCVLGLGRLGLPWALAADAAGYEVRGFDLDASRVQKINERRIDTREPGVEALLHGPNCDLIATTNPAEALDGAEFSVVSVPTPSLTDGSFGLSAVIATVEAIGAHAGQLAMDHVVVLKSTVSPGATDGKVRPALERASGLSAALPPELVYAPEFHAIGSVLHDITHPYLVIVGGREEWALERAAKLHRSLAAEPVSVARLDAPGAELTKLASNCFRTMKIAYANALAELCVAYGSDPTAVCAAVGSDPHIGSGYLAPGLPYGGPCYPRDNPALRSAAASVGIPALLPEAIEAANERRFAELEQAALGGPAGPIGVVGIGFKEGTDEFEGSPALELARRWRSAGREVLVHDPLVPIGDTHVPTALRELLGSCATVLLGSSDATLLAELASELKLCESPPRVLDPWGALSASGRAAEAA